MKFCLWMIALSLFLPTTIFAGSPTPTLTAYLENREPYLMEETAQGIMKINGMDADLVFSILSNLGYEIEYKKSSWDDAITDLKTGQLQVITSGLRTAEREQFAHFSKPYRQEILVLMYRRAVKKKLLANTVQEVFQKLQAAHFRLGLVRGYFYGDEAKNYISNNLNANSILWSDKEKANFGELRSGNVDAILIDRLVGDTLAWKNGIYDELEEHPVVIYSAPISVMFSKKGITMEQVRRFDLALEQLQTTGKYRKIVASYLFPVLLSISTGKSWFFCLFLAAMITSSLSGLLLARSNGYSLIGCIVLATILSLGGSIIRDVLVGRFPIMMMRTPIYLLCIISTVLIGSLFLKFAENPGVKRRLSRSKTAWIYRNLPVADFFGAFGLSSLSVVGVMVALECRAEPLILWGPILGAISSAGGGILCNMLIARSHHSALIDTFYLEIPLIWGMALGAFLTAYAEFGSYQTEHVLIAVVIAILGGLIMRLVAINKRWKSIKI